MSPQEGGGQGVQQVCAHFVSLGLGEMVKHGQHRGSTVALRMRLGVRSRGAEGEGEIYRQPPCFLGRSGLCVNRECRLEFWGLG